MSKKNISESISRTPSFKALRSTLETSPKQVHLKGLVGSSLSVVTASLLNDLQQSILCVLNDKEQAAYFYNDIEKFVKEEEAFFFPASYRKAYETEHIDNANVLLRAEVLSKITHTKPQIIVTYPEALFEKVISRQELKRRTLTVSVNDKLSLSFLNEVLFEYNFKRTDFVNEPGEFSVRGGIIDIFSFSNEHPYRIEFFGDEVESIRIFDVETQCSREIRTTLSIIPNIKTEITVERRISLFDYLKASSIVLINTIDVWQQTTESMFKKAQEAFALLSKDLKHEPPEAMFCTTAYFEAVLKQFCVLHLNAYGSFKSSEEIIFSQSPQPPFNKKFELLAEKFDQNTKAGYKNYICCANDQQVKRFHDIFEGMGKAVHYQTLPFQLHEGFTDSDAKIACYTDHQIFGQYHRFKLNKIYNKREAITVKELNSLEIGDYVTHIDHGIGVFGGLQKIDVGGHKAEAIKLIYEDNDILYVSIHSMHKISKFNGKDGTKPKVYKLGSRAWNTVKDKTKSRIKEIAFNLINVYAKRKHEEGFRCREDSFLQHELEASFLYQDTPDQIKATAEVKSDMESEYPMDRLVCGDVGFGKTEVAIRAAFKAVDNNKQVAILVPTTILAFQHYKTFTDRLKDFPVSISYINRFRTGKEKAEIMKNMEAGKVDIIIGTHALINENIKFKDLGLLIVDEEQKFGVAIKDKLKALKTSVDVLTLTATPIPRTLQFSLMSARDLSVISTPPPNRVPIESRVITFSEAVIRDAVVYELQRGGQVFFINDNIEELKNIAGVLQKLVPDAKIFTAHGRMKGKDMEDLLLAYINGDFDILVATSIIENGLDIPNANTIFINNAHHFGLSDLHQMRGRVGRSNRKAFCFFITPPFSSLNQDARKRMEVLEQFTSLGSGFNIAMKDLEIRGAGDLLGGEQSGFINTMGFETYQKILQETIEDLKVEEFKTLYQDDNHEKAFVSEVNIHSDYELLFPDDYINSVSERLKLYQQLNTINTEADLEAFSTMLKDRFGALPSQASDLLKSIKLKWAARSLGIDQIILKTDTMIGYFTANPNSDFYSSDVFSFILNQVQKSPMIYSLKEKKAKEANRLTLTFYDVKSIESALEKLQALVA